MHPILLDIELLRWRLAGRRAKLWWRDDDARTATPELERLLAISGEAAAPLTLAVIPSADMAALSSALMGRSQIDVAQHGVDHQNRRRGSQAGEFPHDWPLAKLLPMLWRGWAAIGMLPGALPVFAPPWNDVHPALEAALAECGFLAWSANGALSTHRDVRVDVHLDLLRWRGGVRFRGGGRFMGTLRRELARRRRAGRWEAPIGLLTHHLAHDEPAWRFLEDFVAWTGAHPAFEWTSLRALIPQTRREGGSEGGPGERIMAN